MYSRETALVYILYSLSCTSFLSPHYFSTRRYVVVCRLQIGAPYAYNVLFIMRYSISSVFRRQLLRMVHETNILLTFSTFSISPRNARGIKTIVNINRREQVYRKYRNRLLKLYWKEKTRLFSSYRVHPKYFETYFLKNLITISTPSIIYKILAIFHDMPTNIYKNKYTCIIIYLKKKKIGHYALLLCSNNNLASYRFLKPIV